MDNEIKIAPSIIRKYGSDGFPAQNSATQLKPRPVESRPRRAYFHDYCAPGYYHITATTYPGSTPLSSLPDIPAAKLTAGALIYPILSKLGEKVQSELLSVSKFHPELRILQYVIMADHIHFALHVTARLKRKLGYELAGFFGACSRHYNRIHSFPEFKSLFQTFHDRVIFDYSQIKKVIAYIQDNPRRTLIKRLNPTLFRRYLHLEVGEREYAAFGNIFLLRHYNLLPVRIHRRWSEREFEEYKEECMRKVSQGAIPISPFIHKAEREIMRLALDQGGSVVRLTDSGFEARFKPKGRDFEACAEGRLLLLAPWPHNTGQKSKAGYAEFHSMNDMAVAVATMPADTRLVLKNDAK